MEGASAGIIRVPIAPIRSAADDRSEMVTQALFGEEVEWSPLDGQEAWVEVRLRSDGYQGFCDRKLIDGSADALAAFSLETGLLTSPLTVLEWEGRPYHLPAGSRVPTSVISARQAQASQPVEVAHAFLGAPYLWGGKSVLGMDCSGLTQLSSFLCGFSLPRDASLQWRDLRPHETTFDGLRHGDLVFFHRHDAGKVTHVGFCWQEEEEPARVLHASGEVRFDDLRPDGIYRGGEVTHRWTGAARWPISVG